MCHGTRLDASGEPFSDRPRGVCPVRATFLRGHNDLGDERRRADLRPLRRWRARSLLLCLSATVATGADPIGWISARVAAASGPEAHLQVLALVSELCAIRAPDTQADAEAPADRAADMSAG